MLARLFAVAIKRTQKSLTKHYRCGPAEEIKTTERAFDYEASPIYSLKFDFCYYL